MDIPAVVCHNAERMGVTFAGYTTRSRCTDCSAMVKRTKRPKKKLPAVSVVERVAAYRRRRRRPRLCITSSWSNKVDGGY